MKRIVVLISGRGSNLGAIIAARLPLTIAAVICNEPDAAGLAIAQRHNIPTTVVAHRTYSQRTEFDRALEAAIDALAPDLVVLAGFMRILNDAFVARYRGKLINIHPSLLPAFPGLDTHRRAIEAGVKLHGCTVHFVTSDLDRGPIIMQAAVPVLANDDEHALAARVLAQEHRAYPQVLRWFSEDRVMLTAQGRVAMARPHPSEGALISPALDP